MAKLKMRRENRRRARRLDVAFKGYCEAHEAEGSEYGGEPKEEWLSDLLTDLMHWAQRENLHFGNRLLRAVKSYRAERRGD